MKSEIKKYEKILFVGDERICRQVAYVLDIKEYVTKESLTSQNYEEYKDGKIYVCEFKKKSKSIVDKSIRNNKDIKYLNDICRQIDKEHFTNRRNYKELIKRDWRRINFFIRLKLKISYLCNFIYYWLQLISFRITGSLKIGRMENGKQKIKHVLALRTIPSQLFLYVLKAPINSNVHCILPETEIQISRLGEVRGCSGLMVNFGNLLYNGELVDIYNSIYARIVKLSSLNGSYCLCNLKGWCPFNRIEEGSKIAKSFFDKLPTIPQSISVAIDKTCNLCCKSCRNKRYVMNKANRFRTSLSAEKLKRSGYLDQTERLVVAVQGEVFYSPYYRQLLETELQRESICIFSNGILFNKDNWTWLENKYKTIDVIISVDAATAETYQKVRGANFNQLLKNLKMLADLHDQGKIRNFKINFVVQRDNYHEMPEFVKLGKSLGVDTVEFLRMNNFGNLTKKQFRENCMIISEQYLERELYEVLQDPIFNDSIVDLRIIKPYLEVSVKRYKS